MLSHPARCQRAGPGVNELGQVSKGWARCQRAGSDGVSMGPVPGVNGPGQVLIGWAACQWVLCQWAGPQKTSPCCAVCLWTGCQWAVPGLSGPGINVLGRVHGPGRSERGELLPSHTAEERVQRPPLGSLRPAGGAVSGAGGERRDGTRDQQRAAPPSVGAR
ncbi:unnamed protein product [Lepidochelys kempii]